MGTISKIALFLVFGVMLAENASCQDTLACEIEMGNREMVGKDSISGIEVSIFTQHSHIFDWAGEALVITTDSLHQEILCIMTNPILERQDTFTYSPIVIAKVFLNTRTCEIKKEIYAQDFLSKPVKQIVGEYRKNKMLYKKRRRIDPAHDNSNYLLRYCYDLTYAALTGDSTSTELLLSLKKDFKMFRMGLDAEDLYYNRETLYNLLICDKPKAIRARYVYLWRSGYQ